MSTRCSLVRACRALLIAGVALVAGCGADAGSGAVIAVDTSVAGETVGGADDAGGDVAGQDAAAEDSVAHDTAGDATGAAAQDAAAHDTAGDATGAASLNITVADFNCITDWTKVRRFRIKSLNGQLNAALAVANNPDGGAYPEGTVIQLIPTEAMVKRKKGWSPATKDWEFFFLKINDKKTQIAARGTTEVVNGFGGNCFGCHNKAKPKWDLVCEQDHGCDKLPFSGEAIEALQNADSRCKK